MDSFNKFFKSLIEKANLNLSRDLNIDEVRYIISKLMNIFIIKNFRNISPGSYNNIFAFINIYFSE